MTIKRLGISPDITNGVRNWRVIWRPFLDSPVPFTNAEGRPDVKLKSDKVKTTRFPITRGATEKEAFEEAKILASSVYREDIKTYTMPDVNWEKLAKEKGVVIRDQYAKPGLNESTVGKALELYRQGFNDRQVAEQVGVNRTTAMRWRKKHLPNNR